MRFALDATYSVGKNLSGVGVYSREVLAGLASAHPESEFLHCFRPHRFLRSLRERLPPNGRRRLLLRPGGLFSKAPYEADLFHALNQRIDATGFKRTVCTFHDLFVLTGEYSSVDFQRRFSAQARFAAERADLIISVSRFTAQQVEKFLKVEPSRIRVIHHGVRMFRRNEKFRQRERLILHVGAIQKRKNVTRLVDAFDRVGGDWKLMLAGSVGFGGEEIVERINRSPKRRQIEMPGYVSSKILPELYERASIFAFPSLDEGFGMPVLEAMAAGTPVIASNRSALPEVCGSAALMVDPLDADSIAGALDKLISSEESRAELARRGKQRAAEFSWGRAVEETWAVYKELV